MSGVTGEDAPRWPRRARRSTDVPLMWREDAEQVQREELGRYVRNVRDGAGRSRLAVTRATGLGRGRIAAIEGGSVRATEQELRAIADACGTDLAAMLPAGYHLTLTVGAAESGTVAEDGAALDELLREYVAMVMDLRDSTARSTIAIRSVDLAELARAAGRTPEAIQARLDELLNASEAGA